MEKEFKRGKPLESGTAISRHNNLVRLEGSVVHDTDNTAHLTQATAVNFDDCQSIQ